MKVLIDARIAIGDGMGDEGIRVVDNGICMDQNSPREDLLGYE